MRVRARMFKANKIFVLSFISLSQERLLLKNFIQITHIPLLYSPYYSFPAFTEASYSVYN